MTVLFTDNRSYTTISESMPTKEIFDLLNRYFSLTNPIIESNNGIVDKYIGDAIMALFSESPDDALKTAIGIKI
jgi:class 3 adenylate cyclase